MALFQLNANKRKVMLIKHPSTEPGVASAKDLMTLFNRSEFSHYVSDITAINQVFSSHPQDFSTPIPIAHAQDAEVEIKIDETLLVAEAYIFCARGGAATTRKELMAALQEKKVIAGIIEPQLDKLLQVQQQAKPGDVVHCIVAKGRRPKDGVNAKFVKLCLTAQDRILRPQIKDDGKVDMKDLGALITVEPGAALMEKIPPTIGENGFNVFGEASQAKPGKDVPLQVFEGTKISEENENVLVADAVGVPVALARGMRVDNVITVEKVDVTTGHIEFDGSVIVNGDVKEGMKVHAKGDITVLGYVESADLKSKSAITVVKGIVGRQGKPDEPFNCFVTCERDLAVGYAQYAKLSTQQSMFIDKQSLHCELQAGRLIQIGKGKQPDGKLIGGKVLDALRLEVGELGASAGIKTHIIMACQWQDLKDKLTECNRAIHQISESLNELELKSENLTKKLANPQPILLAKLLQDKNNFVHELNKHKKNKKIIKHRMDIIIFTVRITIYQALYSGVEVSIGNEKKEFERSYPPHFINFKDGRIAQRYLN